MGTFIMCILVGVVIFEVTYQILSLRLRRSIKENIKEINSTLERINKY